MMKMLRTFSITGLVFYTVLLVFSCGRVPDNGSGVGDNLNATRSISSSKINKKKGKSVPILYQD
jgi:hypothetical protein